ncbi:MAG: hypothetical protein CM15mP71_4220 [Candidatus Poseidoniales archaeon]|nr:MAG: hypothetical protein CM15mP71_4220 [Candidatus Poseidoniales archaeon]
MMNATFGLVTVETLDGTTGGFLTGKGDMVNAGGYAIAEVVCDGMDDVKEIPVNDCSASVDLQRTQSLLSWSRVSLA